MILRQHAFVARAALAILVLSGAPAFAVTFEADLDPIAYDNSTRAVVQGEGEVTATLTGSALSLKGTFKGLSSDATVAHLGVAQVKGAPTETFFTDLTVTKASDGTVSGTANLNADQVRAVNASELFIRLDTIKGTTGSLWGWFEPVRSAR
jgi:hypothetical protein